MHHEMVLGSRRRRSTVHVHHNCSIPLLLFYRYGRRGSMCGREMMVIACRRMAHSITRLCAGRIHHGCRRSERQVINEHIVRVGGVVGALRSRSGDTGRVVCHLFLRCGSLRSAKDAIMVSENEISTNFLICMQRSSDCPERLLFASNRARYKSSAQQTRTVLCAV